MNKVHVYRAGNDQRPVSIDEKKADIVRGLLNQTHYDKVVMYDDSVPNLENLISLKPEYPKTKFYAWHVSRDGQAREYKRANEGWSEKYKRSIDCSHPKGFSQRAHCQGRKKHSESTGDKPSDLGPKEFVSNKFHVKFTDNALLIFDGGDLVYKKPGNYSLPTRQDASVAKGITDRLWKSKHDKTYKVKSQSPYLVLKPKDIHNAADEKGIAWDNNRKFLNLSKKLTGKSHLDDMSPEELRVIFDYLSKIRIKENFADGRNPQDKGDSKRLGVPTKASITTLRKVAKIGRAHV